MLANAPVVSTRKFVPKNLDPSDWSQIEPLGKALIDRPIESVDDLEKWLADWSELASVLDEYGGRCHIDMTCHTDDAETEKRFLNYVQNIEPKFKPIEFALKKRFVESPYRPKLGDRKYEVLWKNWQADVSIFRDENVPLQTELTKLATEYDKICGAMMVNFRGEECAMPRLARFLENPDRALREEAWKTFTARRLADREALEQVFEKMLPLRQQVARNAGFDDFRGYVWVEQRRFDYTPADCRQFAESIAKCCVPLMHQMDRRRASDLGVAKLRPWDLFVDPKSRPALSPFGEKDIDGFVAKTRTVFDRLSPELGREFDSLRTNKNLDLDSRKGKAPGGYQRSLHESRQPFIFMNATGTQRDVDTLLHEGGHAFHMLASTANEQLVFLREAPTEFCEVASMSMELLGGEHLDVFYNETDRARAQRKHLEGVVTLFPWVAIIDSFQQWLYANPGHSREQRKAEWLRLEDRFGPAADWSGLEDAKAWWWQRQLHLFHVPFYYVEYAIAQLGALQLWLKAKDDPKRALANYRAAIALAGTRPLPQLFAAAGIHFDFSEKTLQPLMGAVEEELATLPA